MRLRQTVDRFNYGLFLKSEITQERDTLEMEVRCAAFAARKRTVSKQHSQINLRRAS